MVLKGYFGILSTWTPIFHVFFVSKWMYTATCTEAYSREVAIPVEIGPVLSKTNAAVKRAAM